MSPTSLPAEGRRAARQRDLPAEGRRAARQRDLHAAARALALLHAHAHRPLHDADGPVPDEQVVRAATHLLRNHQTWSHR